MHSAASNQDIQEGNIHSVALDRIYKKRIYTVQH